MDLPVSATIAIRINGGAETTKTIPITNVGLAPGAVIVPGDVIVFSIPLIDANATIFDWTARLTVNWDETETLPARDYRTNLNGSVTIVRNDGPARSRTVGPSISSIGSCRKRTASSGSPDPETSVTSKTTRAAHASATAPSSHPLAITAFSFRTTISRTPTPILIRTSALRQKRPAR
ncbi:MAG: hypothetical protein U0744_10260 [Gemmataceae bacterium]